MRTSRPAHGNRPATRLVTATLVALLLAVLTAGAAAAQADPVGQVVSELRSSPVFVDPEAEGSVDKGTLLSRVRAADTPIYIAVLPASAVQAHGGTLRDLAEAIAQGVNDPGAYMVTAGNDWMAGSDILEPGRARALGQDAFRAHPNDPQAALLQWINAVAAEARNEPAAQTGGGGGGGGGGIAAVAVLTVLLVGGGALIFGARRRRREREAERQRELEEVKSVANEDLVALGDDIRALDLDTSRPDADPEAVRHYTEAVDQYQKAATALDRARRTEDLAPMSTALEAGRYSMAAAKAILEGRPVPERRPPCFFDPRHGPSVEDVEWAPPDGAPRRVPACAADAQRIHDGLEPESRQVLAGAGGRMTPYWNAPGYYGPWAGGYFGGFPMGGLFTGLALGSFLGGGWGYPVYAGGGDGGDSGGGGDAGGGDAGGGGDWGGGDWGGGDWGGGGDFGGGDFGG
ncbi:MAG TPA: hypothetical protein VLA80_08490 [Actinomycetota bacterium]|nr:hypothetical protein [Actinomycetota bacterium]